MTEPYRVIITNDVDGDESLDLELGPTIEELVVESTPFTASYDTTAFFRVLYRFITVQSQAEFTAGTNEDADIPWENYAVYQVLSEDEWPQLLNSRSIPLSYVSDAQKYMAYCHLIADYFEKGNPDWSFRSQSQAPGVSFSRGEDTGPRLALKAMLDTIENAYRRSVVSGGRGAAIVINQISDARKYPKRWKRSGIPAYDGSSEGYDSEDVEDMGVDYNSQNENSAW